MSSPTEPRAGDPRRVTSTTESSAIEQFGTIEDTAVRLDLANRLFFRLYQCANLLHKTGTRAVEAEGLTTQQWAVLGALSRPGVEAGMTVNELARYLKVSRQALSGVLGRLDRDARIELRPDPSDRRARLVTMTAEGRAVWDHVALPKIHAYYERALDGFSVADIVHTLHYLLAVLDNMSSMEAGATPTPAGEPKRR